MTRGERAGESRPGRAAGPMGVNLFLANASPVGCLGGMDARMVVEEDWEVVKSALPAGGEALARESGALKGLRQDKSAEHCLRMLRLHVGGSHWLRETVLRAKAAGWAHLRDAPRQHRTQAQRYGETS
ncbi:MAG TPA: hypothetical protein VGD78_10290 [Chthoniobacterales bacterium]